VVVGAERPDVVRACAMHAALALDERLALADALARASLPVDQAGRDLRMFVLPHAIRTLPIVAG